MLQQLASAKPAGRGRGRAVSGLQLDFEHLERNPTVSEPGSAANQSKRFKQVSGKDFYNKLVSPFPTEL